MTHKYFNQLNYTLGNEDTTLEIEMVLKLNPESVFSVCGSGGRSLPLQSSKTKELYLCDLSKYQLALAELRLATYNELSVTDFQIFWGHCPYGEVDYSEKRKAIYKKLNLKMETKLFFDQLLLEIHYESILYLGKWEKTFYVFAKIAHKILGTKTIERLFSFKNIEDQVQYYQTEFPMIRWKMMLFLLGNKSVFNALLYKGDFIKKNAPQTHFEYYFNAYDRLFTRILARESFFLNLCFFGKIKFHEGNPVESSEDTIKRIKSSSAEVKFINENMLAFLNSGVHKFDFLSLSDVPSYFGSDVEKNYLQNIKKSLKKDAIVVVRYYLRTAVADLRGYIDVTDQYKDLIHKEKVQMYNVCIYQYQEN